MEEGVKPRVLTTKLGRGRVQVTDEEIHVAFEAYYGEKVECRMIMWKQSEQRIVVDKIYPKIRDSEAEFDQPATHQASAQLAASCCRLKDPLGHTTTGNDG